MALVQKGDTGDKHPKTGTGADPAAALPALVERSDVGTFQKKEEEREVFAQWLSMPKKKREPHTMVELAHQIGVNEATLSIWKNTDRDIAKRVLHLVSIRMMGKHADVVAALLKECLAGNVKAIEVYFKWGVMANMEFAEDKDELNSFERILAIFQSGRVAEMIDAIQKSAQRTRLPIVDADVVEGPVDFTKEVGDGEEER